MRIVAVFVLYHPDQKLLGKGIPGVAQYVDRILLWENSEMDHNLFVNMFYADKIERAGSGNNEGISAALNYTWKFAVREGYDFLLTMDQDSVFVGFGNYLANVGSSHETSGLYGPGVNWMAFAGASPNTIS